MSFLDKMIGFLSPTYAYKRMALKESQKLLQARKYEGAARTRRTKNWRAPSTSANAEKGNQLEVLRNRSRDLIRNNPYAKRARLVIPNFVIGTGIRANIKNDDEVTQSRLREAWMQWTENRMMFDLDGCQDFYGMQHLIMGSVFESGEVLIRRRRVSDGIGIKLQVLEADHLVTDLYVRNSNNGNRIFQGIELDDDDKPVAYHLYKNHPGSAGIDVKDISTLLDYVRVPAEDICHIGRKERPGELRYAPWLHPVMIRLREVDEFEDAMIVRQKIAACWSAFIKDIEAPQDLNNGGDEEYDLEKLEPGLIEYLPPGKDIVFGSPPLPQAESYKFFISTTLHSIAAGLGITYESLTGDLSEVNFSSARMGKLEMGKNIDAWRKYMIIPMMLDKVMEWFLEAATLNGITHENTQWHWTSPKHDLVDPTKEIPSKIRAVRAGFESLSDVIREQGKEPKLHLEEIANDNAMLDELGLVFDSDPRLTTAAGMLQQEENEQNGSESREV